MSCIQSCLDLALPETPSSLIDLKVPTEMVVYFEEFPLCYNYTCCFGDTTLSYPSHLLSFVDTV